MGGIQSYLGGSGGVSKNPPAPQSAYGMVLTLGPVLLQALIFFVIFLVLRVSQRRWYAPRTYLGSMREWERSPELPTGMFNWMGAYWRIPDTQALRQQSLDSYLFLRFLRVCFTISFVGACITWPVLFAVNATGGGGKTQLELLSWANIDTSNKKNGYRLFAHALVGWIFFGFVMYTILRESIYYINLRQAFLVSTQNARRISSRTVLFTAVPRDYEEPAMRRLLGPSVKQVWTVYDTEEVDDRVKERNKVAMKLEKAEVKLLKMVNTSRIKAGHKAGAAEEEKPTVAPPQDAEAGQIADRWVPRKKRPSHRTGLLGLIGPKVDSIEWCRSELQRLVPAAEEAQQKYRAGGYPGIGSVFVEFHTQREAQTAYQVVTHHQALHMAPKYIGVQPSEVVWKSLKVSWRGRIVRRYAVLAFIAALIIFWAIPVAIVGIISSVDTLEKLPFLSWLTKIPKPVMGLIAGLLPSVLMAVLMSLVPIIMRVCAKLSGEVSDSNVELFTQKAYFTFSLIQLFLVRTVGNTASTLVVAIAQNPGSVLPTLSSTIPASSNFYISYFMLQGFTIAAGAVTQVVGLLVFRLLYKFLTATPRAMYKKWTTLSALLWGSLLPAFTNIAVISIVFAIIAPLELFWAAVANGLFYLAYRYNVFFVTASAVDTRGLIYPTALMQLFSGIYIGEVCLIGLFAVSNAPGPLVLMVFWLIVTILFHLTMKRALHPLMFNLPSSTMEDENAREGEFPDMDNAAGVQHVEGSTAGAGAGAATTPVAGQKSASATGEGIHTPASPPAKRPGIFARYFKPWVHADYATLRDLVRCENVDELVGYSEDAVTQAYLPPSVVDHAPLLWIPEDAAGVSKQEIQQTSGIIHMTDENCSLDEKNKIVWDQDGARPPVWDSKVWY